MAQAGAGDFNQDFACAWSLERDFVDVERPTFRVGSGRARFI
jgi:hypothetical protein